MGIECGVLSTIVGGYVLALMIGETFFSHFEISSSTQQLKAVSKQRCSLPDLVN